MGQRLQGVKTVEGWELRSKKARGSKDFPVACASRLQLDHLAGASLRQGTLNARSSSRVIDNLFRPLFQRSGRSLENIRSSLVQ